MSRNFYRLAVPIRLNQCRAAHPAFKYAIVVAGLAGIVAGVLRFGVSPATLVFGIIVLVVLMVLFFVFAQVVTLAKTKLALPALVLTWTFLLLAIGAAVGVLSSAFFDVPLPLKTLMLRNTSTFLGGKTEDVPPPNVLDTLRSGTTVPTRQRLAGVIWDENHETVADVEVFVPEFNVTTFTDRQGKFLLQVQATPQRQVRLIARKEGYKSWSGDPTLGNTSLSFVLRRKP